MARVTIDIYCVRPNWRDRKYFHRVDKAAQHFMQVLKPQHRPILNEAEIIKLLKGMKTETELTVAGVEVYKIRAN